MLEFLFILQYQCFLVIILLSVCKRVAISLAHKEKPLWSHIFFKYYPFCPTTQQNTKIYLFFFLISVFPPVSGVYQIETALFKLPTTSISHMAIATYKSLIYFVSQNIRYSGPAFFLEVFLYAVPIPLFWLLYSFSDKFSKNL